MLLQPPPYPIGHVFTARDRSDFPSCNTTVNLQSEPVRLHSQSLSVQECVCGHVLLQ